MPVLLSFPYHASRVSVVTSVSLNLPAWTSSILLCLFQVWYKQLSIRSLLWVLWSLYRAHIKGGFSEWQTRGCWGFPGAFWGKTCSITKPSLNAAERLVHSRCRWAQLLSFPETMLCSASMLRTKPKICLFLRTAFCQKAALAKGLNWALF